MTAATVREAFAGAKEHTIWAVPDMTVLNAGRRSPVPMPADLFGPAWPLLQDIAEGVSTAPDYPGMGFLAACASLIGGKRRIRPYATSPWSMPCILWVAAVGDPSSRKSPALEAVMGPLRSIEMDHAEQHKQARREWQAASEWAKASRKAWQDTMATAVKDGLGAPPMPDDAVDPDEPERRRTLVQDSTPEALGPILAGNPQGTLHFRDELAGWLNSFDRYTSGGGRELWLEAYEGKRFTIDRKSSAKGPLTIPFLGISVAGGIQPEKLAAALLCSIDDGLVARFLWSWPDKLPTISRPRSLADIDALESCYRRLDTLPWGTDGDGRQVGITLPLTDSAADVFLQWQRDNAAVDEHASSLFKSFVGKMDGTVLRLALVAEYIRWAWTGGAEPVEVSADSLIAAGAFVDDYCKPMAERVLGDAALPVVERHASIIGKYIRKVGMRSVNKGDLKQSPHKSNLPGELRDKQAMDAAFDYLVEARWLLPNPTREGDTPGRQRGDYNVNPAVLEG